MSIYVCTSSRLYYNTVHSLLDTLSKVKISDSSVYIMQIEGVPTRRAYFGEGRGPVHLSRVECTSRDSNLLNCTIDKTGVNGCTHSEDAGVICNGMSLCMCVLCVLTKLVP